MSIKVPSRMEALAVCRHHRDYYRAQAEIQTAKREYGRVASAVASAAVCQRIMDTLQGKATPLGVTG